MAIIDNTYFDGTLIISGMNTQATRNEVDASIIEFEDEYLLKALGATTYVLFKAAIAGANRSYFSRRFSSRFVRSNLDGRWGQLRDGCSFTAYGRSYIWPGFASTIKQQSPIAQYVYFWHRDKHLRLITPAGNETQKGNNRAQAVEFDEGMVKAWNRMVVSNLALLALLYCNPDIYPEFNRMELNSEVFTKVNPMF